MHFCHMGPSFESESSCGDAFENNRKLTLLRDAKDPPLKDGAMMAMTAREIFARWHNALALRLLAESRRISSFIERRLTALLLGW